MIETRHRGGKPGVVLVDEGERRTGNHRVDTNGGRDAPRSQGCLAGAKIPMEQHDVAIAEPAPSASPIATVPSGLSVVTVNVGAVTKLLVALPPDSIASSRRVYGGSSSAARVVISSMKASRVASSGSVSRCARSTTERTNSRYCRIWERDWRWFETGFDINESRLDEADFRLLRRSKLPRVSPTNRLVAILR